MKQYVPPPLALALQLARLREQNVDGTGHIRRAKLTWHYDAMPTPVSRSYRLRLEYAVSASPQTFVVTPRLQSLAGERCIPHLYDQETGRLCLYLPKSGEWHNRLLLAHTMVPWSLLWLMYFEEWLASNEWKGGGMHPK